MSIQSMTGFGKGETENDKYVVSVEIKTVNNRFKDIRFKMSNIFNALEIPLKKKLDSRFNRGSFDIYVNYKKNTSVESAVEIDKNKVIAYIKELKSIAELTQTSMQFSPTDFLRGDFYMDDESREELLEGLLLESFDKAIVNLEKSRIEEGLKLKEKLIEHRGVYEEFYQKIIPLKNEYQTIVREKLTKKFENEFKGSTIDDSRFMQEVIYYLEKLDIDEEINRISVHLAKFDKLVNSDKEIGREVDFLVQELNRETNTIGSKSGLSQISEYVVQMKVQLEKIREQALNLE
jgi:uncharacterized protein (TIGR00255 family)